MIGFCVRVSFDLLVLGQHLVDLHDIKARMGNGIGLGHRLLFY